MLGDLGLTAPKPTAEQDFNPPPLRPGNAPLAGHGRGSGRVGDGEVQGAPSRSGARLRTGDRRARRGWSSPPPPPFRSSSPPLLPSLSTPPPLPIPPSLPLLRPPSPPPRSHPRAGSGASWSARTAASAQRRGAGRVGRASSGGQRSPSLVGAGPGRDRIGAPSPESEAVPRGCPIPRPAASPPGSPPPLPEPGATGDRAPAPATRR